MCRILHCKARQSGQQGWQGAGRRAGCRRDAWEAHPGRLRVPPEHRHSSMPPSALPSTRSGRDVPMGAASHTPGAPPPPTKPGEGWGCKGLRSPSMMPHLVLRPSTRLPFTWCSWSAPTTAKGIFSCRRRGACSPGVLPGSSRGHLSPTVVPRSQHSQSRHPDTHPNPVVQQPVVWVLVEVLLWVHADGVGLQVLLDLWDTGLELGSGGTHEAPWEPLGHLPSPVA